MSYEANGKKSKPKAIPVSAFGKATTPTPYPARHDRPNYILINKIGNYSFAYESGSLDTYVSGSQVTNAAGGPIRLDINPIAWISKGGVAGDITFVYTGR
tara:strand:+ start:316 stop:615 length:300 start_codon:yes stop_codon:yes gene_type:complete